MKLNYQVNLCMGKLLKILESQSQKEIGYLFKKIVISQQI